MRATRLLLTVMVLPILLLGLAPAIARAQAADIVAVIQKSADDWNRGDLAAYVQCYEQSPDTTFVGNEVSRGMSQVLDRYRRAYPDKDHMGTVTFSELAPRILTPDLAIVTGRFHLTRTADMGGNKAGIFTLVLRKGASGWRIIHDHTSAL
jgi:uncharacterized protein (TIGR02246 family)